MTVALQMCVHYFKEHGEGSVSNRLGWVETFGIWGCLRVMLLFWGAHSSHGDIWIGKPLKCDTAF